MIVNKIRKRAFYSLWQNSTGIFAQTFLLFLLLVGGVSAFLLSQENQELRQQARTALSQELQAQNLQKIKTTKPSANETESQTVVDLSACTQECLPDLLNSCPDGFKCLAAPGGDAFHCWDQACSEIIDGTPFPIPNEPQACNKGCETNEYCQSLSENYICHNFSCKHKDYPESENCLPPTGESNHVPECTIRGPSTVTVGELNSYDLGMFDSDGDFNYSQVFVSPTQQQSWTQIGGKSYYSPFEEKKYWTCENPGEYYLVCNARDNSGNKCTGNPWCEDVNQCVAWDDCGDEDRIKITCSSPTQPHPTPTIPSTGTVTISGSVFCRDTESLVANMKVSLHPANKLLPLRTILTRTDQKPGYAIDEEIDATQPYNLKAVAVPNKNMKDWVGPFVDTSLMSEEMQRKLNCSKESDHYKNCYFEPGETYTDFNFSFTNCGSAPTIPSGEMCSSVAFNPNPNIMPERGDTVAFQCNPLGLANQGYEYHFRISSPDGKNTTLTKARKDNPSLQYTLKDSGRHKAQCMICPSGSACEWGNLPDNTACSLSELIECPGACPSYCDVRSGAWKCTQCEAN